MSKQFGKTWWGQQWLNSLAHIDYDNRLPRGSSYARKGAVEQLTIEGNMIHAKVAGSRPRPYDVTIVIPPFFEKETRDLIGGIAKKPVIISKLLNRELEPEVLAIAESKGLKVFPRQWTDFKMVCNCPDWAVPCKHLAAVVYKVSAEIDNNPFLVFQLHNVDLIAELEKENIYIRPENTKVLSFKELLSIASEKKSKTTVGEKSQTAVHNDHRSLNYVSLQSISDSLIQLLADSPAFYQNGGNFKDKYAVLLIRAERNALRVLKGKTTLENFLSNFFSKRKPSDTSFALSKHTELKIQIDANNLVEIQVDSKASGLTLKQLIDSLWQIPTNLMDDYQSSVIALRTLLQLSVNLIATGAVIPQIIQLENKIYQVRWLPATISKDVKLLLEQTQRILANTLDAAHHEISINYTINLISPFLSTLIELLAENKAKDIFLNLFFDGSTYPFQDPGEKALPGGINSWLQRYYIAQSDHKPAIIVDELNDHSFRLNIEIEKHGINKKLPLRDILTQKQHEKIRFDALQSLAHLSSFIPNIDEYINNEGQSDIILDNRDFAPFLIQIIPALHLLDINILLPKSLQEILKPKASVRIKSKPKNEKGFMRLDNLLDYNWQVAIGDTLMDEEEFGRLVQKSDGLIKYKANYIYVSPGDLEKLHKHFSSTKNLSPLEMLRIALSNEYNGARVSLSDEVKELIRELTEQPSVPLPPGLNATLRPYQQRGFAWMYRNSQIGFGCVIADDMGLGKTLQVIATLLKYKDEGVLDKEKALVVAPTGLLTNWIAEFEKFAPSMNVQLYHGIGRQLDKKDKFDVLLTSYGIARSDAAMLKKMKWQAIIIDEAQNIKNQDTAQSKAIKSIGANTFIAMSGTPVENRLSELWSIMDFANKGLLGNLSEFREVYGNPIQNQNDIDAANKLKLVTSPFMMRRLKSDKTIIGDLPDKIEIDSYGYLVKEQASLYHKTLQEAMNTIEGMDATDHKSLFIRQGLVLQMILALKQICNHPTQFLKNKVLDASLSGKVDLLFEKLDSILEAKEKVLIFTQFTEMGNMLQKFIEERYNETPMFYHGGCTLKQRKEMVDRFQNNRVDKIFILSLKAAGTGLNLTAANHVIHYDLWWNPAVEAQATDRAYRIGQKSNVMVHRFITKGTFEERINEMIQNKKALADMTVATGENWIGNLNNNELRDLFELK
ncbi:SNF2-related protein [Dysgonomonas reticulitermitis]